MEVKKHKKFGNGYVYALTTSKGKLVETTDTFLPYYTINAVGRRTNALIAPKFASRSDRIRFKLKDADLDIPPPGILP